MQEPECYSGKILLNAAEKYYKYPAIITVKIVYFYFSWGQIFNFNFKNSKNESVAYNTGQKGVVCLTSSHKHP